MSSIAFDIFARDHASNNVQKVGRSFGGLSDKVSRFGGMAAAGLGLAASAMGTLAVAGGLMGVKTAANLQQANIAFETLLGSTKKAKSFLSDLKTFAAKTPFELPGLINASRQLVGVGQSAESVIPTLTAWGDAAGALGLQQEAFDRAMLAVTQSMAKGKVQAEELMQITEAGIPVYPLLAKAMGKPVSKIMELGSEGKLLAKDVFPALEKQMNKDYGGAMAKQSKTLSGLWSTFMDTLNMGLAEAIMPLVPMLQKTLPGAIEFLGGAFKGVAGAIKTFGGFIKQARDFVSGIVARFQSSGKTISGFGATFSKVGDAIGSFVKAILPTLRKLGGQIMDVVGPALGDIGSIIQKDLAPAFIAFLDAAKPVATFLLNIIGGTVITAIKGVIDVFKGALQIISGIFNVFAGIFSGDWSRVWNGIKQIGQGIWNAIKGAFQLFISVGIGKVFALGAKLIRGIASKLWGWVSGIFSKGIGAVKGFVQRGISAVVNFFKSLPGRALGAVRGLLGRLGSFMLSVMRAAGRAIGNGVRNVVNWFRRLPGRVISALSGFGRKLWNVGVDMIKGLINGIKNMAGNLINAARGVVDSAIQGAKNLLGIGSPSKVFRKIGEQTGTGLVLGLKASQGAVSRAGKGLAGAAIQTPGLPGAATVGGRTGIPAAGGRAAQPVVIRLELGGNPSGMERMFLTWLQGALRANPGVRLETSR